MTTEQLKLYDFIFKGEDADIQDRLDDILTTIDVKIIIKISKEKTGIILNEEDTKELYNIILEDTKVYRDSNNKKHSLKSNINDKISKCKGCEHFQFIG